MRSWICILLVSYAAPSGAEEPAASSPQRAAKQHLERGLASFRRQAYVEALEEFRIGYELGHDAQFLFAIAQSLRKQGHCEEAIASYREFLRARPAPSHAAMALRHIARCEQAPSMIQRVSIVREEPPPAPPPAPNPEPRRPPALVEPRLFAPAPKPVIYAPPTVVKPRRWYRDSTGMTLALGSAVTAAIGIPLLLLGAGQAQAINTAPDYGSFARAQDGGQSMAMQYAGIGLLAGAGIVAIAGIARLIWVARHPRREIDAPTVLPAGVIHF